MATIEITAPSLDEAKKEAAAKLGVAVSSLKVTVLEESKGLFGKSQVRIQAEAKEKAAKGKEKAEAAPAPVEEAPAPVEAKPAKAEKPAAGAKKPLFGKAKEESAVESAEEPAAEAAPAKAARESKAKPKAKAEPAEASSEEAPEEVVASKSDADFAKKLLESVLKGAQLDANVASANLSGKYVNLVLDGKDSSYLVGKTGEVLNALQYLMNIAMSQQLGNGVRVVLDGNHFRERREKALTALATSIAEQVLERGEEAVLDALPAFERRIVHKALSEIDGVATYSEGEEPNRRVVIAPA